jgi:hypothetical protein
MWHLGYVQAFTFSDPVISHVAEFLAEVSQD